MRRSDSYQSASNTGLNPKSSPHYRDDDLGISPKDHGKPNEKPMTIDTNPTRYQTVKLIPGTPVFILYGGQSEDGRGLPEYKGKTFYPAHALTFYREHIKKAGGHAKGHVLACYDDVAIHVSEDWLKNEIRQQDQMMKRINKHLEEKALPPKGKPKDYGTFA